MKNPRTLNTDYDAWLRRLQVETVEEILQNISWDSCWTMQ